MSPGDKDVDISGDSATILAYTSFKCENLGTQEGGNNTNDGR